MLLGKFNTKVDRN